MVDLVPRDVAASVSTGARAVRMESTNATVIAQFAGPWRDWLVFDVTVTNHADSVLRVEPSEFSMTLSTAHGRKRVGHAVKAVEPERTLARLDLGRSGEGSLWGVLLALEGLVMVADMAYAITNSAQLTQEDQDDHAQFRSDLAAICRGTAEKMDARMADRDDERERWMRSALARRLLEPGQSVGGAVALPGATLRRLVGPDEPEGHRAEWAITGPTKRPAGYYRVILHAPPALGGQRFEFDVGAR